MNGGWSGATEIDISTLVSKKDLASLKRKVDDLDANKVKTVPNNLSKPISNVVDNDAIKNTVHDKLVIKINAIDTKIPSTTELTTKTQYYLILRR